MNIPCPKCSSTVTRLEEEGTSVLLRCRCGYCKVMSTTLVTGLRIEHIHIDEEVQLPKKNSKLMHCLGMLATLKTATTREICEGLINRGEDWSSSETASFLTILKHRGLVETLTTGKGVQGGSTWVLTPSAKKLLKL